MAQGGFYVEYFTFTAWYTFGAHQHKPGGPVFHSDVRGITIALHYCQAFFVTQDYHTGQNVFAQRLQLAGSVESHTVHFETWIRHASLIGYLTSSRKCLTCMP
ncbi:hypothetical protein SS50377_24299 [Spironucleus salmonicida]|nr:hypothetical protein SS50377_24299 [Spironucleus salmonicida]